MSHSEPTIAKQGQPPETRRSSSRGRRALLGTLVALAGGTAAWLTTGLGAWRRRRGPRERDLAEADLYGPHELAG